MASYRTRGCVLCHLRAAMDVILGGGLLCARLVGMAGFLEVEKLIWLLKIGSSSSR